MVHFVSIGLMIIAGSLAYAWRTFIIGRARAISGLAVICLPVLVLVGVWIWSELTDKAHAFHALPPEEGLSIFEAALLMTIAIAPFWSFGALCGYLLRRPAKRP